MFKLVVFVPETHCESLKEALFAAGAGRQGHYECCAWQVLGEGQFRPMRGAKPAIGAVDELSRVAEYRVEVLCDEALMGSIIQALRQAHPYEEPAFEVYAVMGGF